jgi:hypothetical protein
MNTHQEFEVNNWRVWNVNAVDEKGQAFFFQSYAQDEESAIADKADELRNLRVTSVTLDRN